MSEEANEYWYNLFNQTTDVTRPQAEEFLEKYSPSAYSAKDIDFMFSEMTQEEIKEGCLDALPTYTAAKSTPKAKSVADAPEPPKAEVATEGPAPVPAEAAPAMFETRTICIEVRPLGGDGFKVTLDASKPTVREAKAGIARTQGTAESRQELYRVAERADGVAVREDDAEPEPLDDESMALGDGDVIAMAVKVSRTLRRPYTYLMRRSLL
jgi:hypothetical protein